MPLFSLSTPWKYQKTKGLLMFAGVIVSIRLQTPIKKFLMQEKLGPVIFHATFQFLETFVTY